MDTASHPDPGRALDPDFEKARRAMMGSHSLLNAILATVPDAMIVMNAKGQIAFFSAAAQAMFGFSEEEVLGQNVSILMASPHRENHDAYLARYLHTGKKKIIGTGRVVEARKHDGTVFPIELAIGEAEADGHRIFTGFVRDLTERFKSEARMEALQLEVAHASRLSSMGTLTSAMAHELNQPLTAITNYMAAGRDLLDQNSDEALLREAMDEASKEALRAGQIVRRLRDFVSKRRVEREIMPLAHIVKDAVALALVGTRDRKIQCFQEIDPDFSVIADPIQIQQVLINLIRNAVEAMEHSPVREIRLRARRVADHRIEIDVSDTGPGLDPAASQQLFEPFYSTKATGMGLGLSICRTLVEAHGGSLTALSNPGGGTIFRFSIEEAAEAVHEY